MPWRDAKTIPFTRIDVVARVPSGPGVYAVMTDARYLLVGEAWNLKARLLELANLIESSESLSITYELCPEDRLASRKLELEQELQPSAEQTDAAVSQRQLPGISFWTDTPGSGV